MGDSAATLEARLRGLADAAEKLADDARRVAQAEHEQALRALKAAETSIARPPSADAAVRAVLERRGAELRRDAEVIAPGVGSSGPDHAGWFSESKLGLGSTPFLRLGRLEPDFSSSEIPAIQPLLGSSGWQVLADTPSSAHRLLQSMAVRLVATAEPFRVKIDSFDPKLTGAMGMLGQITTRFPQIVPKAAHTASQIHDVLSDLVEESSSRAGRMARLGHQSFEQLIEDGSTTDPYRVIVLFDYPAGIDGTAQRDLVRLAATAADRGICFLVHADQSIAPAHDVRPEELVAHLMRVDITGDRVKVGDEPGVEIGLDPPFSAATTSSVCDAVVKFAESAVLPTVEFARSLPNEDEWWQPARDELSTVIGYVNRTPAALRLRTGNPALPHVLIGGAAGQGKSNLLLVLIHGLAVRYAPRDLEMYLLDFKHGVEFAPLGPHKDQPHWLPHVKVLGVHSDRAFGLAVLRHLSDELTRRSTYFKEHGSVSDLSHLADDPGRPPRILLVLDEFQVLLEEDDEIAAEAVRLIEKLMRQGRAYGVHAVLATQTIQGMGKLALRKDSIFGQVPYRIALKSTQTDSQAVLRSGNAAAADLQFRGEAILNANFGAPEDNQRVLVAYAPPAELADLRQRLHARARAEGECDPPRMFRLGEPARLADAVQNIRPVAGGAIIEAWAGLPIAVAEQPAVVQVRQDPGSGVVVLGDGPLDAIGVLSGLTISAAAGTAGARPRIVVLDGASADRSTSEAKAAMVQTLIGIGCELELIDQPGKILERIQELYEAVAGGGSSGTTYVLAIGMHMVPRMTAPSASLSKPNAAEALNGLMSKGPAAGFVSFAWWNRLHTCTEHLGLKRADVGAYVFLQHPQDGVRRVCGALVKWASEPQRALLWDGVSPEPQTVVPFAPLNQDDVDPIVRAIGR